jgi:hypothetical protein
VAVNATAAQSIGHTVVVDSNSAELLDANGAQVTVSGGTEGWQVATGSVAAVAGEVDGAVNGVLANFTQVATGSASVSGDGSGTVATFTQEATGSQGSRNASSTSNLDGIAVTATSTVRQKRRFKKVTGVRAGGTSIFTRITRFD